MEDAGEKAANQWSQVLKEAKQVGGNGVWAWTGEDKFHPPTMEEKLLRNGMNTGDHEHKSLESW